MKHFIENLKRNNTIQLIGYVIGTCIICCVILGYLLNIDISQAPTYIYSQF